MAQSKKRTQKSAATPDGVLELQYRLSDLPTSQHRAGLVGLVVLTRFLAKSGVSTADASVKEIDGRGARLEFTRAGMNKLFDAAFATKMGEVAVDKPYKKKNTKEEVPPIRVEAVEGVDKKGKPVSKTKYIYPKAIPSGAFLEHVDPTGADGLWIKLWRDMLWSIPRGVPATRRPFEDRAQGQTVSDGDEMFAVLRADPAKSVELASTYFLGSQATNADNVTFSDSANRQLLLHFWPFATELFVPGTVTRDGKTAWDGYVFAFPDVADLEAYCEDYWEFLRARGTEKLAYLPKSGVVDLPGEAGLRTLAWLQQILATRTQRSTTVSIDDLVFAVDVIHARKDGNNVRVLKQSRVEPRLVMSVEYERYKSSSLWSHVFRRQLLENLLGECAWFSGFSRLLSTLPPETTFRDVAFQHDARLIFEEKKMSDEESSLAVLVHRVATNYLTGMLRSKYDLSWSDETKGNPIEYNEKKEKLAREALLAMRSRTGTDFIEYVTMTVFSVAQNMSKEHYTVVSGALLEQTETFRTLLMLAFSAQMPRPRKPDSTSN